MAYKLVETALAQADLDAILSYLALSLENPTAATAFANEVEKCYTALEQMPYLTSSAAILGFLPRATVKLSSSITC